MCEINIRKTKLRAFLTQYYQSVRFVTNLHLAVGKNMRIFGLHIYVVVNSIMYLFSIP